MENKKKSFSALSEHRKKTIWLQKRIFGLLEEVLKQKTNVLPSMHVCKISVGLFFITFVK
jgi:hypothetical protein